MPYIILPLILHICITGDIADAHLGLLLVFMPFGATAMNLGNTTFGARAPGVAVTPRRYRLPTEVTRLGRAWLAWKVYLYRGLLHSSYMKFDKTRNSW